MVNMWVNVKKIIDFKAKILTLHCQVYHTCQLKYITVGTKDKVLNTSVLLLWWQRYNINAK